MSTHITLPAQTKEPEEARMRDSASSPSVGAPAVEIAGLTRSYGPKPVLRGVDLRLARGGRLALFGANGAGKTTLLRVLATLARPDGGQVRILGRDVVRDAAAVRRMVGYVGHEPYVYEELTARENLIFFGRMYGLPDPAGRARELLERMGLAARANDRVHTFSRGLARRLALARSTLHAPAVLLLDEPETGLDEPAFALLRTLVAERARAGQTTLLTTHHLEQGVALADEVAVLARGRVVYTTRSAELDTARLRDAIQQQVGRDR
ncbi:MAG: ABC transporter ATP-binding protein [Ktedonobacterales bacterium]